MRPDLTHFFTPYKDPLSGVTSYILTKKVAPIQEAFYFINPAFSKANRYLWFYCAYPPAGDMEYGRTLGVIDFEKQTLNHYPETEFINGSPLINAETGGVYWANQRSICYRGPAPQDKTMIVALLPEELYGKRHVRQVACHLTFSPSQKEFFLDSQAGMDFFAGTLNVTSGEFQLWKKFDRLYSHGQFCPLDENLVLLAQENQTNILTGSVTPYEDRLWLLQRNGIFKPVMPQKTRVTHEWWVTDGKHLYACNQIEQLGGPAIIRVRPEPFSLENIWPGRYWHAHDFNHGEWLVADQHHLTEFYRGCPSRVSFINRRAGKEIIIISLNPEHHSPGGTYHIDPHPRFSPDGSLITFTTTVLGQVDLAVTFTSDLLKLM